ncbi:hypothetical protein BHM03_00058326 [Ensete ventricosum]|nr:hypothetical protein BHM03_00058326 [Ensete ventricosum]
MVLRSSIVLYLSISGSRVWTMVHRDPANPRDHQLNLNLPISRNVQWKKWRRRLDLSPRAGERAPATRGAATVRGRRRLTRGDGAWVRTARGK